MRGAAAAHSETDLLHTDFECVAFDQSVHGNEAELATIAQQRTARSRNLAGRPTLPLHVIAVPALKPRQIVITLSSRDLLASAEWGITNDRVEAGVGACRRKVRERLAASGRAARATVPSGRGAWRFFAPVRSVPL